MPNDDEDNSFAAARASSSDVVARLRSIKGESALFPFDLENDRFAGALVSALDTVTPLRSTKEGGQREKCHVLYR